MSLYHSHLSTAVKLIESFKNEVPFSVYIKQFFSANKKYGSRDRKNISSLCYNYFRIGNVASDASVTDRILLGTFLCTNEPSEMMGKMRPEWNNKISQSVKKKIALLKKEFSLHDIFSFKDELSNNIDLEKFSLSFLVQPDLFLRLRPRNILGTTKKLERLKVASVVTGGDCVSLANATNIEDVFLIDKEVVVQDYNSQKVLDHFKPQNADFKTPLTSVWDCCAASGGKSILMYDIFNQRIDLTISDVRPSIVLNLHKRFTRAGIKTYNYFIADLLQDDFKHPMEQQQVIICDVPCSGSGTWSRTPEQLTYFDPLSIDRYSSQQQKIVTNVLPYLQSGGTFVYITCSVFKKENEEVVEFIKERSGLQLLSAKLLIGYENKADNMFVAVFKK